MNLTDSLQNVLSGVGTLNRTDWIYLPARHRWMLKISAELKA
ncbi:Uncharacterised protein [Escherichia coli]|uniref:Uncharacterized protein n=1 Tax=Escherichia coli TaxID=562 RepID=A0A3S4K944_ECOLX|nr:Uncharacterised protein [Escherichia coli]